MNEQAHSLRAALPDLADQVQGQLINLYNDPTPDRCDRMIRSLSDTATTCARLRAELQRGETPTV